MRDWLRIPAFTPTYAGLAATDTTRLIDRAFAELPDSTRKPLCG